MAHTIEQWMKDAAEEIKRNVDGYAELAHAMLPQVSADAISNCIAAHAPRPEDKVGELVAALKKAQTHIISHHELGHLDRTSKTLRCELCEKSTVLDDIARALAALSSPAPAGTHVQCTANVSTGIDGSITAGWGKLDEHGYFERPCRECERRLNAPAPAEEWVRVGEAELPTEGEEVEIYTTAHRRLIAKRRANFFEFSLHGTVYSFHWQDDVTHYRRLPAPPKEDQ